MIKFESATCRECDVKVDTELDAENHFFLTEHSIGVYATIVKDKEENEVEQLLGG